MPTLLDGTVIDESADAYHQFTPEQCQQFYGRPRVVRYITIHHWGNRGQDFDTVKGFLCSRRDNNPTSAHAVIMAGRAASIISPDNVAFHAGSAVGNADSIGLECRPEATDEDYITVACYIVYLRSIYGDVPLRKHSDWYATACPGVWDLVRLDNLARDIAKNGLKKEDEVGFVDGISDAAAAKIADAILYRNVPWYGFEGSQPKTGRTQTNLGTQLGWMDTSYTSGIKATQEAQKQIGIVLDALKALPEIDNTVIDDLKNQLGAKLEELTKGLQVTLKSVDNAGNPS